MFLSSAILRVLTTIFKTFNRLESRQPERLSTDLSFQYNVVGSGHEMYTLRLQGKRIVVLANLRLRNTAVHASHWRATVHSATHDRSLRLLSDFIEGVHVERGGDARPTQNGGGVDDGFLATLVMDERQNDAVAEDGLGQVAVYCHVDGAVLERSERAVVLADGGHGENRLGSQ